MNNPLIPLTVIVVLSLAGITFRRQIRRTLALRITILVFGSVFLAVLAFALFSTLLSWTPEGPNGENFRAILGPIVFIIMPFLIGFSISRVVNRPLRHFTHVIHSLEDDKYHAKLTMSGIKEFDQVFEAFNHLTARLKKEEELRKDLISDTSHELNTPLAAMTAQLVAMQEGTLPITKKRIALLKEQTDRLIDLVQQLDAYTKARVGDHAEMKLLVLKHTCSHAFRTMLPFLNEKGITYELRIADDLKIKADEAALKQILTNLIQNTYRYAEATRIRIVADRYGLTYSDNGKGVPDESLPHLFERFYRVDPSRNRESGGLGLGLAIVAELIERQGWAVAAEAAHPGLAITIRF